MKITKFAHSCLLVEMPAPVDRTVLFDPGIYSTIDADKLEYLDDIIITHKHSDHMDPKLIKQLQTKFPEVQIIAPSDAKAELENAGIGNITTNPVEGVQFFDAPHEPVEALGWGPVPEEIGVHYLDALSNPGDSFSFSVSKAILAMPVTAPWGSSERAAELIRELKPKYVIPIHDWHWNDQARQGMYNTLEAALKPDGITFIKPVDGEPFVINL